MANRVERRASRSIAVIAAALAAIVVVASVAWLVLRDDGAIGPLVGRRAAAARAAELACLAAAIEPAEAATSARTPSSSLQPTRDEASDPEESTRRGDAGEAHGVAGMVVDDLGAPLAGASVQVVRIPKGGNGRSDVAVEGTTDELGRFDLDVADSEDVLLIVAHAPGHQRSDAMRFDLGDRDHQIVLIRGPARLLGHVLFDEAVPWQRLRAALHPVDVAGGASTEPRLLEVSVDGRFRFQPVPPGSYDVSIFLAGFDPVLGEVARSRAVAVIVPDGEEVPVTWVGRVTTSYDPKTHGPPEPADVTFDLRGQLRVARVRVTGPSGEPPFDTLVRLLDREGRACATVELEDGVATLVAPRFAPSVEIWAPGCRVERLLDLMDDREIALRPGIARTLDVQLAATRDVGDFAYLLFLELAPDDPRWPGELPWLRAGVGLDGRGRLEATSPGRHRVNLKAEQLSPNGSRRGPPVLVTSVVVDVDDASEPLDVVVPVSSAELDRALAPPK